MSLTFDAIEAWWWPYVYILIGGFVANDVWRFLGVIFAGRLSEESELFALVKAIATALVAGVIAQLVLFPSGALATSPLWLRLAAVAVGFAAFKLRRDTILAGVLAGEAVFVIGRLAIGG